MTAAIVQITSQGTTFFCFAGVQRVQWPIYYKNDWITNNKMYKQKLVCWVSL